MISTIKYSLFYFLKSKYAINNYMRYLMKNENSNANLLFEILKPTILLQKSKDFPCNLCIFYY